MACPQHDPTNGVVNPNISNEIIEVQVRIMVEILPPKVFNIINNMSIEPMFCKHFIDESQHFQKNQWLHDKAFTCHSKMHNESKCIHSHLRHP